MLKFITRLKKSVLTSMVVAEDILQAEKLWIQDVQEELKEKKDYYHKLEGQLGLFVENCIARCRGRISRSSLPFTSKFPALLPRDHYITKLIVEHSHLNVFHGGVKDTLTELRANYWVPKGRQLVRKLIHVVCFVEYCKGSLTEYQNLPTYQREECKVQKHFAISESILLAHCTSKQQQECRKPMFAYLHAR